MEKENLIRYLLNTNLVRREASEEIARRFLLREIPRNELFLKEGRVSDEYLFLDHGFMRAFAMDTEGNDVTTNFYAAQEVVFEVSSFFNRSRSRENIQAVTDCQGWSITFVQLNELFHALPEFREFGRHILVKGFTALKNRMLSTITETAEERYQRLLQNNPAIFQHFSLKHISSYLGITDTSLSRIRKKFAKQ
jgi:CRP-like cAMP-binding protein